VQQYWSADVLIQHISRRVHCAHTAAFAHHHDDAQLVRAPDDHVDDDDHARYDDDVVADAIANPRRVRDVSQFRDGVGVRNAGSRR